MAKLLKLRILFTNILTFLGQIYRCFAYNIIPCCNRNEDFKNQVNRKITTILIKKLHVLNGSTDFLLTMLELLCCLNLNCFSNHIAEFKIDRTSPTCLNQWKDLFVLYGPTLTIKKVHFSKEVGKKCVMFQKKKND